MTLERDIWLAAKAMIQQYGNDAGFEAAKRADKHLEGGRLAHCATWERIMTAIEKMQAEVREGNFSGACQSFFQERRFRGLPYPMIPVRLFDQLTPIGAPTD
jgi:hypothetical protein